MVEQTLKVQSRGGRARALNHGGCVIQVGRVGRSSHPQIYAGQAAYPERKLQGEQGKATRWGYCLTL